MGTRDGALVLLSKGGSRSRHRAGRHSPVHGGGVLDACPDRASLPGRETLRKTMGRTRHNQGILKKQDTTATT